MYAAAHCFDICNVAFDMYASACGIYRLDGACNFDFERNIAVLFDRLAIDEYHIVFYLEFFGCMYDIAVDLQLYG